MVTWPFAPFAPTTKDWVDVATAIGTCAAAIAAVAIAVWQRFQQRGTEMAAARMTCAYLIPRVSQLLHAAETTLSALLVDDDGVSDTQIWKAAEGSCHPLNWTPTPEQLAALSPLPRHAGYELAKAIATGNSLAFELKAGGNLFGTNASPEVARQH
jgi:hypothetical protein